MKPLPRRLPVVAAALLVAALSAAYLPYVGNGFKQDDFGWIATSRVRQAADWPALLARNTGFYRPVVAVTFTLDELAFGMKPLGYGLTNLVLLVACLLAIAALARSVGLASGAALAAGAIWAFNLQGINMATVWISGRTALVLVLFSALAARAFVRSVQSPGTVTAALCAALFTLLALLAKEEAVTLPVALFAWAAIGVNAGTDVSWRRAVRATCPLVVPLAVYAILRQLSGAFGPLSAPPYYRFTFSPAIVADNALKYADFAGTTAAGVVLLAWIVGRVVPRASASEARIVRLGVLWMAVGYGVTLFLPIRSPLYACLPAVGAALAASALLQAIWTRAAAPARWRLAAAGVLLPFLLLPVYWSRNVRHGKGARLSAQLLDDLKSAGTDIRKGSVVVLLDDPRLGGTERLGAAFGAHYELAVSDTIGQPVRTWIDPPPDGWEMAGLKRPDASAPRVVFALRAGHLVRVPSPEP